MDKDGELIKKIADSDTEKSERKARLLRQGDFYRAGIVQAKANIKHGAKPETIFHNALDHATFALRTRVDGLLRPTGINVGTVMPYAMSVISFINRRRLHKPAIGVAALMAGAAWYAQRQRSRLAQR
ncbi:MAG TPA: hypothetical protein VGD30_14635 [Telluria sp.]